MYEALITTSTTGKRTNDEQPASKQSMKQKSTIHTQRNEHKARTSCEDGLNQRNENAQTQHSTAASSQTAAVQLDSSNAHLSPVCPSPLHADCRAPRPAVDTDTPTTTTTITCYRLSPSLPSSTAAPRTSDSGKHACIADIVCSVPIPHRLASTSNRWIRATPLTSPPTATLVVSLTPFPTSFPASSSSSFLPSHPSCLVCAATLP